MSSFGLIAEELQLRLPHALAILTTAGLSFLAGWVLARRLVLLLPLSLVVVGLLVTFVDPLYSRVPEEWQASIWFGGLAGVIGTGLAVLLRRLAAPS